MSLGIDKIRSILICFSLLDLIGIKKDCKNNLVLGQIGDALRVAMSNGLPGIYWLSIY